MKKTVKAPLKYKVKYCAVQLENWSLKVRSMGNLVLDFKI